MADHPVSEWVLIDRLVPHPDNPNEMSEEDMAKLRRNIELNGGHYPAVVVRDLAVTRRFTAEREQGLLQIIDGEHRWRVAKSMGAQIVHVQIWRDFSDTAVDRCLQTLNHLHGKAAKKKRQLLLKRLAAETGTDDAEELALVLPHDADEIAEILAEAENLAAGAASDMATNIRHTEPLTIFVTADQRRLIEEGLADVADQIDPDREQECREGAVIVRLLESWRA